jgi:hypothetical protein
MFTRFGGSYALSGSVQSPDARPAKFVLTSDAGVQTSPQTHSGAPCVPSLRLPPGTTPASSQTSVDGAAASQVLHRSRTGSVTPGGTAAASPPKSTLMNLLSWSSR